MVVREVNPLEQRHMALSSRFKAAWAFNQLLIGMQRMNADGGFENKSDTFQSLFSRLKKVSESLQGPTIGQDTLTPDLAILEREVDELYSSLVRQEEKIAPSDLRRFFSQVRALDDRILIEVVRFYLEVQRGAEWRRDRLDKVDFLISRMAEKVAGPDLQSDQRRLDKVLQGLLSAGYPVEITEKDLIGFINTLQDLQSEVRWVKTFEELSESSLVAVYRALKHDMQGRIFHPKLLPLVVRVNNAFRRKIDDLRAREQERLLDDYEQLNQLQESSKSPAADLVVDMEDLKKQVEIFRKQAKSDDIRLSELAQLGEMLRGLTSRVEAHIENSVPLNEQTGGMVVGPWFNNAGRFKEVLVPDLDELQPQWSALLKALSDLGEEIHSSHSGSHATLAPFELESREMAAFRRTVGSEPANVGLEQFILAAAALRHRLCEEAEELRNLQHQTLEPDSLPEVARFRDTLRMADAFVKHFTHLVEQAVLDGEVHEPQALLLLKTRLVRDLADLQILWFQLSTDETANEWLDNQAV